MFRIKHIQLLFISAHLPLPLVSPLPLNMRLALSKMATKIKTVTFYSPAAFKLFITQS